MFHGCRVALVNEQGNFLGSAPVWFVGTGIISGFLFLTSTLFLVVPPFAEIFMEKQIDYTNSIYVAMVLIVSFASFLWYNEVMESIASPYGKVIYPAWRRAF